MNALHSLGQLIQSVEDSKGWTVRHIGRRTDRAPKSLTHTYIGRLKREPIRSVTYDMVQSLAIGLDVPERVVALAAIESMGVHDVDPAEAGAAIAIARDPSLSDRDRRVLLAVVREMQSEDDQQAPDKNNDDAPGVPLARDAQPDGITEKADVGGHRPWGTARKQPFTGRGEPADERELYPWEKPDFDLAAMHGPNRGKEMRRRQDDEAERPDELPTDEPA